MVPNTITTHSSIRTLGAAITGSALAAGCTALVSKTTTPLVGGCFAATVIMTFHIGRRIIGSLQLSLANTVKAQHINGLISIIGIPLAARALGYAIPAPLTFSLEFIALGFFIAISEGIE